MLPSTGGDMGLNWNDDFDLEAFLQAIAGLGRYLWMLFDPTSPLRGIGFAGLVLLTLLFVPRLGNADTDPIWTEKDRRRQ